MASYTLLIFIGIVALVHSEVVPYQDCKDPEGLAQNCTIHEVRINPCKEAAQAKPCRIKQPSNASISFDYTANFQADSLESRAYWTTKLGDIPFVGMETGACAMTPCPVQIGQKQTYTIALPISQKYPSRTYDVKWNLWNPEGEKCCFVFQLKLHK